MWNYYIENIVAKIALLNIILGVVWNYMVMEMSVWPFGSGIQCL